MEVTGYATLAVKFLEAFLRLTGQVEGAVEGQELFEGVRDAVIGSRMCGGGGGCAGTGHPKVLPALLHREEPGGGRIIRRIELPWKSDRKVGCGDT